MRRFRDAAARYGYFACTAARGLASDMLKRTASPAWSRASKLLLNG